MKLVDSHCHLDFPDFAEERAAVIARARAAGIGTMVTICTKITEFDDVRAIAESDPDIWCTVGIHPHNAGEAAVPTPEAIAAEDRSSDAKRDDFGGAPSARYSCRRQTRRMWEALLRCRCERSRTERSARQVVVRKCIELLTRRGRPAPREVHREYLAAEQQRDFVARKQAENPAFAACFVQ